MSLRDIFIRHQVLLERVKSGQARNLASTFDKIDKATSEVLQSLKVDRLDALSRTRLEELLTDLKKANKDVLQQGLDRLDRNLQKLAGEETAFEAQAIAQATKGSGAFVRTISAKAAYESAKKWPLGATGQMLDEFTSKWSNDETLRVNNVIRRSWAEGKTIDQTVQMIRGTKARNYKDGAVAMGRRNAQAVARTAVGHVSGASRMALWEENDDLVTGYKFVATLDSRTTIQCRSLDGKVYKVGSGPMPPIHINCRSTTVAELDKSLGLDFLDEGATRSSKDGYVDAKETYYTWLKKQSPEFQNAALGKTRATLFRDGGLSAEKFAALNLDRNFRPLTIDEMRKLNPLAFKRAGLSNDGNP